MGLNFGLKFYAAGACAVMFAMVALAGPPAEAAAKKKEVTKQSRVVVANNKARTRIRVQPRSFLDGGTEVLPGERKFTDYAYPPAYFPMGVVTNTGGRVGWHQSPLPGPFDLPGRNNPFGW